MKTLPEECAYCGAEPPDDPDEWSIWNTVPLPGDDDMWLRLRTYHNDGCDWIETRAHMQPQANGSR